MRTASLFFVPKLYQNYHKSDIFVICLASIQPNFLSKIYAHVIRERANFVHFGLLSTKWNSLNSGGIFIENLHRPHIHWAWRPSRATSVPHHRQRCITGSAVALHCCKAHSKINRKMESSTPCTIVTPENFILKLGTRDYVKEVTYYTIFDADRLSGGFSPNRWNITLLWLFFLSCPFFSRSNAQLEPRAQYSRFMAQMTWFRPRTVLFGVRTMSHIFWGNCAPKTPQKGAWIGVFKPKSQNTKTCISSKLPHRFQPNFAQW